MSRATAGFFISLFYIPVIHKIPVYTSNGVGLRAICRMVKATVESDTGSVTLSASHIHQELKPWLKRLSKLI